MRLDDAQASRRALQQAYGEYPAAVPPLIAEIRVELAPETIALAEEASQELARFDAEAGRIAAPFASILLHGESASSSEVENLTSRVKQVALAEFGESKSSNGRLVLANVHAMTAAITLSDQLDESSILALQDALLRNSAPERTGRWRHNQMWIGGGSISPHSAMFMPPHRERAPDLMAEMLSFARRTSRAAQRLREQVVSVRALAKGAEVDSLDFIALTWIRITHHRLWDHIRLNQNEYLGWREKDSPEVEAGRDAPITRLLDRSEPGPARGGPCDSYSNRSAFEEHSQSRSVE